MFSRGKWLRTSLVWLVVLLALGLILILFFHPSPNTQQETVSTILAHIKTDIQQGKKDTLEVASDTLTLTRGSDPTREVANINSTFDITAVLKDNGIDYTGTDLTLTFDQSSSLGSWLGTLSILIPSLLIVGLLIFMIRQAQGSNNQAISFGKSRARMFLGNKPTVTFADVAGVEEAKQ